MLPLSRWLTNQGMATPDSPPKITLLGHVVLTGSLVSAALAGYLFQYSLPERWQVEWVQCPAATDRNNGSAKKPMSTLAFVDGAMAIDKVYQQRLQAQMNTVDGLMIKYCRVMAFFYSHYYATLTISLAYGLLSLISLFFVSKKGWDTANHALINAMITCGVIAIYFAALSQVFQQRENLKASQDLYASAFTLSQELSTFAATRRKKTGPANDTDNDDADIVAQITAIDSRIAQFGMIRIGFDPTPVLEMTSKIQKAIPAGTEK